MNNNKFLIYNKGGEKMGLSYFRKMCKGIKIAIAIVFCLNFAFSNVALALRPDSVAAKRDGGTTGTLRRIGHDIGRQDGGTEVDKFFERADLLKLPYQTLYNFQNLEAKIIAPVFNPFQGFVGTMNNTIPSVDKSSAFGANLPVGTIDVPLEQLIGLDVGAVPFGLRMTKMKVTALKGGNLDLNDDSVRKMLMANIPTAFGSSPWVGGLKDIKAVADANAVFIADLGLRNLAKANPKKAYVVLGDEGKRDNSKSLKVGSIYWSGYEGGYKEFETITEALAEIKRLKAEAGVTVDGFVGDSLEVTNGAPGVDSLTTPTNSWSLGVLFKEVNSLVNVVNDEGRIAGISGNWKGNVVDLNPLDLPSEALRKIAKAEGVEDEEAFAKWMQNVDIFTLGERKAGAEKDYEKGKKKHRHQAIIDDANALAKKYSGFKVILTGDGTAMPRLVSITGLSLEGRRLFCFGRDGSNEATTALMAAKMTQDGHFIHMHVSESKTADNLSLEVAHQYTDGTVEKTILSKFNWIKDSILDPNNKNENGVWEDVSETRMRLKPNTDLKEVMEVVRPIAKGDFDKVEAILQKATSDEKKIYADLGISESVYMSDKLTEDVIQGDGVIAMTSVTGAAETIFGEKFAELLQRIKFNYNDDKSGEVTTSTFLVTPGGVSVVTAQFESDNLFQTRAEVKSVSPEAKEYLKNTELSKDTEVAKLWAERKADEAPINKTQFKDEVDRMMNIEFGLKPLTVKRNIERILRQGILGGWGMMGKATGKTLFLPVDQPGEHGPWKTWAKFAPNADIWAQVGLAYEMGMSGYVAHPESILKVAGVWAKKIPLIAKMNMSIPDGRSKKTQHSFLLGGKEKIKELADAGVAAVGFTIYEGSEKFNEQMIELQDMIAAARENGLAVIVWSYPRGGTLTTQDETAADTSANAAYTGIVSGADFVKIKPSEDVFQGEQTLDDYKDMFAKIQGHSYLSGKTNDEKNQDELYMDWLRFGELSDADIIGIFEKYHGHAYDAKSKEDKKLKKELENKMRPEQKGLAIKYKHEFRSLEARTRSIIYFSGSAGRDNFIFSGGPAKDDEAVLREIAAVHLGGAKGSIVGRNMFQRDWIRSTVLGQKIVAVIRASAFHEFDSVDDLLAYALQVELPKVKAELNLPAQRPKFGPYYAPKDKTYKTQVQEASPVAISKPNGALIVDSGLLVAGGVTEIFKETAQLKNGYVVFVGTRAEAMRILSGEGPNIFTAENETDAIAQLAEKGVTPVNIKLITTVFKEELQDIGVDQKIVSLDTVSILFGVAKAIKEINQSPEADRAFNKLYADVEKTEIIPLNAPEKAKILAQQAIAGVETLKIQSRVAITNKETEILELVAETTKNI